MNINVYLRDDIVRRIDALAAQLNASRSAVIRDAIDAWMARQTSPAWPASVLEWRGDPTFPPFEGGRPRHTRVPRETDPFDGLT